MPAYQTIAEALQYHADPIKGSRFIADLLPISTPEDAATHIQTIQHTFPDASHHCWAWRLHPDQSRSSDDGEPGGSAGRPILAQIEGHNLTDILVVVTRYYGGTKLGVGGLIRAYGGTAGKALDRAEIRTVLQTERVEIQFAYEQTKAVEAALRDHALTPIHTDFQADVRMVLLVPVEDTERLRQDLTQQTAGKIRFPTPAKPLP